MKEALTAARDYMAVAARLEADGEGRDPDVVPSIQRAMAEAVIALHERCERMERAAQSFADAVDAAIRADQRRWAGGQHVPFHGDFANVPLSGLLRLQRYAREMKAALAATEEG